MVFSFSLLESLHLICITCEIIQIELNFGYYIHIIHVKQIYLLHLALLIASSTL